MNRRFKVGDILECSDKSIASGRYLIEDICVIDGCYETVLLDEHGNPLEKHVQVFFKNDYLGHPYEGICIKVA